MSVAPWPLSRFRRGEGARPLVFGHRGVRRAEGPAENTLAAFAAAAREGADGVELDARLAASGELVVFHDATLARMTGGADTRALADLSFAELRRVELPGGERVPLVADALALAREAGIAVNVEIKHDAPDRAALVRAAARLLHVWDPAHAVLVSSFDPAMLAGIRLTLPRVPVAQLVHKNRYSSVATRAAAFAADAVHIERVIASRPLIDAIRRRGRIVDVWTVNSPVEARDLAALGVDGLITDVPGDVLAALGSASR
jgi:glycerophosphoryl diester phosphodiesterase